MGRHVTNADHSGLTEDERVLIEAAKMQPWTWALRAALVAAVERRGYRVGRRDNAGDLVDFLELIARQA